MNRLDVELEYARDHVGQDLQDLPLHMSDHLVDLRRGTESRARQDKLMDVVRAQSRRAREPRRRGLK